MPCLSRVYPRVYGGTIVRHVEKRPSLGLSPRLRGNRKLRPPILLRHGSIPACTGEPGPGPLRFSCAVGLSPRVRGTLGTGAYLPLPMRSIPACTGEPVWPKSLFLKERVYPRVYGGTFLPLLAFCFALGLSPRVRGNRSRIQTEGRVNRSIPACTGEPLKERLFILEMKVYPRVYGGTVDGSRTVVKTLGLSPRVRGNLGYRRHRVRIQRSIPACTGEPRAA